MTLQRRRLGTPVKVYGLKAETSRRGEVHMVPDMSAPVLEARAWAISDADRYQDMDLNGRGEQEIVMFEIGLADHPAFHDRTITSSAVVEWDGYTWDVTHPPKQSRGANRHVRHWRLQLRRRPLGEENWSG